MSNKDTPAPLPEGDAKAFWEGCGQRKLLIQRCQDCQRYRFFPSPLCPECMSDRTRWVRARGRGHIYSFMTYHHVFHPAWAEEVPYVVAIIELEEGVRLVSNVVGCHPAEVEVGMEVEVVFQKALGETVLPQFRPVGSVGR